MAAEPAGERCEAVSYCPVIVARRRIDQILKRVERGETVFIHKGGRVIAQFSLPNQPQCAGIEVDSKSLVFQERVAELRDGKPTNVTREEMLAWRHEGHKW